MARQKRKFFNRKVRIPRLIPKSPTARIATLEGFEPSVMMPEFAKKADAIKYLVGLLARAH